MESNNILKLCLDRQELSKACSQVPSIVLNMEKQILSCYSGLLLLLMMLLLFLLFAA